MRLRQVALIAGKIAPVQAAFEAIFGLEVAFRDPAVGVFGLANVVMPVGGEFLEILEPTRPDASGARYLARRGGDAGYMVILQADDALPHRARLEAAGVRVIAARDEGRYRFTHFHPADCAGVLLSIDAVEGGDWRERDGDWPPAGPKWRDAHGNFAHGIRSVTIQAREPGAAAEHWSRLLDRPLSSDASVRLDRGEIRFAPPVDDDGTGVVGVELEVAEPRAVFARAEAYGAALRDGSVVIGGTAFTPVA